ncbi:Helix-turn-helix domain-containing protein [Halomicrobium zhouii]|uniref:Helix-turn-helix domain-containing protein n=1 Tax=Halomicrobium zhouii TaxID=767519 RepID=A0A1I6KH32_9EURY|nr:winged helix-turn-helix domain-containing protein [Halomicrobium zhouii]SFR90537.1 Helix-turn-helix domain-containing protein [Halomicrobium zhouii]
MSEETELATVVELLDDEYARAILAATSIEPMSASELAERCDASPPTVYRRLDRLREQDLVEAAQQLDPEGHHYEVFSARLARLEVELDDGDYQIEIERRERDAADRFTELFEGLK